MQFQVPQFIETEDKIIGPFTLKQFFYIGGSVGISLILYFLVYTWLWIFLSIFLVGAGVALAFVKINGRPLPLILFYALLFYWKPHTYVWKSENPQEKKEEIIQNAPKLEEVVSGLLLKAKWRALQTKEDKTSKETVQKKTQSRERFEIFQRISGQKQIARRIDYR